MANARLPSFLYSLLIAAFMIRCHGNERKAYIVYMGERPRGDFSPSLMHHSMLESVLGSASLAQESLIYSYGRSFSGFAAKLTDEEVEKFSEMESVISVIPNRILKLHTTRSWDFMGFPKSNLGPSQEGNITIGFIDTGIWPESISFNEDGLSPPPARWKGKCTGANFTCNNKIIGARYYNGQRLYDVSDVQSPRDTNGHGTHVSSTAAGRAIDGASYYGLAKGVVRGGLPNARIAVYKVCWSYGCSDVDILAAFDDAIADGVDILSVSLGYDGWTLPYFEDTIAIGSFHAMRHGILSSTSAGNYGPFPYTVSNFAPWKLTVAASTIDRKFVAQVVLGNGQVYTGLSINNFDLNGTTYPLIWGGDAVNYSRGGTPDISRFCFSDFLNSEKVARTIVFCEGLGSGLDILNLNGVGTIMADYPSDVALNYPLPATQISIEDGNKVLDYIRSTEYPFATILVGETWKDVMAPSIASFSSRGPNPLSLDILKPDLTAPGVDILAAWSPLVSPYAPDGIDPPQSVNFNIVSGTSVSCPHTTAVAAFIKATYPNWSPAAIKSALMTTANIMDARKHPEQEFAYGSGHINPSKAVKPGLVYDTSEADYINFLCKQGYNATTLRQVTGTNSSVCNSTRPGRGWDLNYPSFALAIEDGLPIEGVFTRTVTNVGLANSTYAVSIYMPHSITVTVEPSVLSFSNLGEKKTFKVKVSGPKIEQERIMSGAITWNDGVHVVRSPLVVYNFLAGFPYGSQSMPQQTTQFRGNSLYRKNGILGPNKVPH